MSAEQHRTPGGIAYELEGSGPPVLLMHAGLTDRRMWDPQWPELTRRFTAIRLDLRGYGASDDPSGPYSLHDDAIGVLDDAGIDSAGLVGCSMGGGAALDVAIVAPDRASSLVLVNSTPSGWKPPPEMRAFFEEIEAAYDGEGIEAADELMMRLWLDGFGRTRPLDPAVRKGVSDVNREMIARQWEDFEIEPDEPDPPALARLAELKPRTLVMVGGIDVAGSRAGCEEIIERAGTERVDFPDAAHLPNLEEPEAFREELLAFLETQSD